MLDARNAGLGDSHANSFYCYGAVVPVPFTVT